MKRIIILVLTTLTLYSCGNASAPKVIPGAGGMHLYDLMDEDSTEMHKADSVRRAEENE